MTSKTRVAPLKQQSVPHLELGAALLLSQLIRSIKAALRNKEITVYAWCDSTIVLSWLSYVPAQLKTFVGNRTSQILDIIPRHEWRHVDSKSNPADCASRGMMTADLIKFPLWWNGPSWLWDKDQFLEKVNISQHGAFIPDKRIQDEVKINCLTTLAGETLVNRIDEHIQRCSSWTKLVHIMAYVLRFIHRMKNPFSKEGSNSLKFQELQAARDVCLRQAQTCFQEDYQSIPNN
jgi:hypothetical protein